MNEGDEALSEKVGAVCTGCEGDCSGEQLASEDRSDTLGVP